MSIAMPGPWKHPATHTYYLKQRVPADLVKIAAGSTVVLPVDGATHPVKVGDQVKLSLRTKNPRMAKEVWKAEREREGRSGSTAARWSAPVRDFVRFLEHDDAGRVRPEDIVRWREAVLATGTTIPRTFNGVHLCAVRSIFNEGRGKKLTTNNPTEGLSFRVSKARQSRPKGFVDEEALRSSEPPIAPCRLLGRPAMSCGGSNGGCLGCAPILERGSER